VSGTLLHIITSLSAINSLLCCLYHPHHGSVGVGDADDDDVVVNISKSRITMAFDVAHVPLRCAFFLVVIVGHVSGGVLNLLSSHYWLKCMLISD
jgi:hypothetical protein